MIRTVELMAWDLDDYAFRPRSLDTRQLGHARALLSARMAPGCANPVCEEQTRRHRQTLDRHLCRTDLQTEMRGLKWSLGIVDLRPLLAFQRRLSFPAGAPQLSAPAAEDWEALCQFSFAPPHPVACAMLHDRHRRTITLTSANPNLHLRVGSDPSALLAAHPGSPFFEVAHYRGRWFLRDGYHRAYTLLRAGVFLLPAVIIHARTLEEVGAVHPWFFSEAILFSQHPPLVSDFLDPRLTLEYSRPATLTTLRITMEESIASLPSFPSGGPS
jgi:hypothetical protein